MQLIDTLMMTDTLSVQLGMIQCVSSSLQVRAVVILSIYERVTWTMHRVTLLHLYLQYAVNAGLIGLPPPVLQPNNQPQVAT